MLTACFRYALNASQSPETVTHSVLTACPALQQSSHLGLLGSSAVAEILDFVQGVFPGKALAPLDIFVKVV